MLAHTSQAAGSCCPTRQLYLQRRSKPRATIITPRVAPPPTDPTSSSTPDSVQRLVEDVAEYLVANLANMVCNETGQELVVTEEGKHHKTLSTQDGKTSVSLKLKDDGKLVWSFNLNGEQDKANQIKAPNVGLEQAQLPQAMAPDASGLEQAQRTEASGESIPIFFKHRDAEMGWGPLFLPRKELASQDPKSLLAFLKSMAGYPPMERVLVTAYFSALPAWSPDVKPTAPDNSEFCWVTADVEVGEAEGMKYNIEWAASKAAWLRIDIRAAAGV